MGLVEVHVGVAAHVQGHGHLRAEQREACLQHGFLAGATLVGTDAHAVVARQPQADILVGETEAVVGVELCGVETGLIVLDGLAVEALEVVALEDVLRRCPVGIAELHLIDIARVVVREFVEADLHRRSQTGDGRLQRVVVDHHAHGPDLLAERTGHLRLKGGNGPAEEGEEKKSTFHGRKDT